MPIEPTRPNPAGDRITYREMLKQLRRPDEDCVTAQTSRIKDQERRYLELKPR
jgi:hypothetical protein